MRPALLPLRLLVPTSLALILLLILPTFTILLRSLNVRLVSQLNATIIEALRLSLLSTSLSLLIILITGIPTAYLLARYRFPGHRLLDTLLDLPIVLPPTVAGVGLLLVFGRRGLLGRYLNDLGINLAFTTTAVVIAQIFVAGPLFIRAMKSGFSAIPEGVEAAALTLGAGPWSTFWRISLPLTFPSLIEGFILAWTRALGEFGATIVFAGSFPGRTQTMPLAIYAALEYDLNAALILSAILTLLAFSLLGLLRYFFSLR